MDWNRLGRVAIFYGSSTCYTEIVAERIQSKLGLDAAHVHNVAFCDIEQMQNYDLLFLGIPTWDYGELQEDWDEVWDQLESLDLQHQTCAIFGLGDQVGYPDWFQDAMGYLYHTLAAGGAKIIGAWPNQGYTYTESKALSDDQAYFRGLPLDEERQADLTESRLDRWLTQVYDEYVR